MPRKPKPPLPELFIEAISTGQRVDLVDDFTGQPLLQPTKPRKTSAELHAMAAERNRLARLSVLVDAGLGAKVGYARERTLRSPAKLGERAIALGADLVIVVPAKPWRRV